MCLRLFLNRKQDTKLDAYTKELRCPMVNMARALIINKITIIIQLQCYRQNIDIIDTFSHNIVCAKNNDNLTVLAHGW